MLDIVYCVAAEMMPTKREKKVNTSINDLNYIIYRFLHVAFLRQIAQSMSWLGYV